MTTPPDKSCQSCGRRITWRKRWEKQWDQIRYCGQRCRRHKVTARDLALEALLLRHLQGLPRGHRVSDEAIDALAHPSPDQASRERVRCAARRLAARGQVVLTQGKRVVEGSTAKGSFCISRP